MGRKAREKKERAGARQVEGLEELRARAEQVCGTIIGDGEAPPEVESEFLRQIIAFHEQTEDRNPLEMLREMGKEYRPSSELSDEELSRELPRLAEDLAFLGIYLESTDHLSDRDLYDKLLGEILLEPMTLMPGDPAFGAHIDLIGGFSEEDIEIYLRYYADDETREDWNRDFPEVPIPPKEKPPYPRNLPDQWSRFHEAKES